MLAQSSLYAGKLVVNLGAVVCWRQLLCADCSCCVLTVAVVYHMQNLPVAVVYHPKIQDEFGTDI